MRAKIILLLIAVLFVGMCINIPNENDYYRITQDKLDEFEEEIVIKGNEYQSNIDDINPGIVNSAGKKVEGLIDKAFDFCFGIIKGMIDNE